MKPFCEQLCEVRKRMGMTQEQLAREMNITRQGVSRWENGKSLPDIETLKRLTLVLHHDFMTDEEGDAEAQDAPPAPESAQESIETRPIIEEAPASNPPRKIFRLAFSA